ncbi:MAG TPA: HesA/MoeB/ThiF family protein [Candidatus Hydrogenedentes bacterium]|nr:HesA/MoeB/ThiF family protein [Candidatus Hydrogenedentota bacterium]
MSLDVAQRVRYERNLLIPGWGEAGQARLAAARVLIVGLGGLGSPAAQYLAAAGVGALGLLDSDAVELSNLQRQVVHTTNSIGVDKPQSAAAALGGLNPNVRTECLPRRLTAENAADVVSSFDVIVEAADNFETKFLINDVCLNLRKPFATAGALAVSGQAMFVVPGKTPCMRCLLPEIPRNVPTTGELGILGTVPGILGSIEAMEVIRWIAGLWTALENGYGRLHVLDGERMRLRTIQVSRRVDCRCAGGWDE